MTDEPLAVPPEVEPASPLEAAAEEWIGDYFNARHLLRTRDWIVALDPSAGEALRIAALTHDIERREPGGPELPFADWADADYLREHSERSARIVEHWLATQGAGDELRTAVGDLIRLHEVGGGPPAATRLQAADSLSFLEVNAVRARAWVQEGRCTLPEAHAKLDWTVSRIRLPHARALAQQLHERAVAALDGAATAPPSPPS